jgi:hypothetical protein
MSRFVMLSGPSCVGKGPLYSALRKFYPEMAGRFKQSRNSQQSPDSHLRMFGAIYKPSKSQVLERFLTKVKTRFLKAILLYRPN